MPAPPDTKRKLTLLLTGTYSSLTPIFSYVLVREVAGIPESSMPLWFRFPVHLALLLFPVSLAYVIIVHRALDLRVVLRSGLQYTLARGGVRVLQMLLGLGGLYYVVEVMQHGMLGFWSHVAILGGFVTGILLLQILSERLFSWIDRRFFRDAYSAEHVLADLAEQVRTVVDPQQLFHIVADRISTALHVPQIAFFLANGEHFEPAFAHGALGSPSFAKDAAPIRRLREEREPVQLFLDDQECWIYDHQVHEEDRLRLAALNAQLLLPLEGARGLVGFVSLSRKRSEEPYSRGDMRLLRSVGVQTGLALENSRLASSLAEEAANRERANRELEIAREVQQRLFPQRTPEVAGVEILGTCRPALAVGGDYYDYFEFPGGSRVGLAVGDVSGKGVGAAIMMATVQASLRTQVLDDERDLAASVSRLNQVVYEASTRNRFATLFYAQFDRSSGRLVYVNAGHNRPVIIRRDGEIERLALTGIAIGLKRHFAFRQAEVTLSPGDLLVAFTDGLSESMNHRREEWGEDELAIAALELSRRSVPEIVDGLIRGAEGFAEGAPQHDDMTLIVLRSALA
jgi:sigma-B regulation protein RsbU (phosphoserine phosphatase)